MLIAVIGDIHGFWDDSDTAYFNSSDYDALLFVGDLPRLTNGLSIARELARITKPAWLIPGNHDGCTTLQLLSEIKDWQRLCTLTAHGMDKRVRRLAAALGPVQLCGFQSFELEPGLGLISARPHAMGPDRFYFRKYLSQRFGVTNFAQSAAKLKALVDRAPENLVFLAHNGPAGLGDTAQDIWGCDFSPEFGDFGDPDLREAVDYAKASGHRVLAVTAGHMHLRSKQGGRRKPVVEMDDTLYINAGEVARIRGKGRHRHHVRLTIGDNGANAEHVWVDADGQPAPAPEE